MAVIVSAVKAAMSLAVWKSSGIDNTLYCINVKKSTSPCVKLLLTLLICTLISVGYAFAQKPKPTLETAEVTRVIDGGTIEVKLNGQTEKVRLIGVDTPELKDASKRVQCFAQAAWSFTEDHLPYLDTVELESDYIQGDRDNDVRLLRYVWYNNGNFKEFLIKKGFGYEYANVNRPYKYQKEFKAAQKYAEKSKWGLYDKNECK
jgi:endonuclease YncB( thermonuclease family)